MNVEFVMRGSLSMNPHCSRISSRAFSGAEARKCDSSSNELMNGETVAPASGAGAPYFPQRALRALEMAVIWEEDVVKLDLMAQELPSWG